MNQDPATIPALKLGLLTDLGRFPLSWAFLFSASRRLCWVEQEFRRSPWCRGQHGPPRRRSQGRAPQRGSLKKARGTAPGSCALPVGALKGRPPLAVTIQLGRSCLLDLLAQILRRSVVTGLALARASLTPRLAQASASQSLPSQLNRYGLGMSSRIMVGSALSGLGWVVGGTNPGRCPGLAWAAPLALPAHARHRTCRVPGFEGKRVRFHRSRRMEPMERRRLRRRLPATGLQTAAYCPSCRPRALTRRPSLPISSCPKHLPAHRGVAFGPAPRRASPLTSHPFPHAPL